MDEESDSPEVNRKAIEDGMSNVYHHLSLVKEFGLPCVVAVNRRPGDTDEEVEMVRQLALEGGAFASELNEAFEKGGDGASKLAEAVVAAADAPSDFQFLYPEDATIKEKIHAIATKAYGADDVVYYLDAERKIEQFTAAGLDKLPMCMAKTPLSLTHDPTQLGAPTGFTLPVRDMRAYTGAGWLVPLCGDIMQMPGLGKTPAAFDIDIDADGNTVGLF
jgi:formyltetrahydrofolate synthetase